MDAVTCFHFLIMIVMTQVQMLAFAISPFMKQNCNSDTRKLQVSVTVV